MCDAFDHVCAVIAIAMLGVVVAVYRLLIGRDAMLATWQSSTIPALWPLTRAHRKVSGRTRYRSSSART